MSDKPTKIDCRLVARGTKGVEAQADDDLNVPDPDSATGKRIIKEALEEDEENGDQQANS